MKHRERQVLTLLAEGPRRRRCGAQFLVTRNARDFKAAQIETRSAGETLALLTAQRSV